MAIQNAFFGTVNANNIWSGQKCIIKAFSTSVSSNYKFRFYLELIYDGKTYAYTFRTTSSSGNAGFINITSILQTIVEPNTTTLRTVSYLSSQSNQSSFANIHAMPYVREDFNSTKTLAPFTGGAAKVITAKIYEFYSTTANGTPQKQGSSVDGTINLFYGYPPANISISKKNVYGGNLGQKLPTGRPNMTKNYWEAQQYVPNQIESPFPALFLSPLNITPDEITSSFYATNQKIKQVYVEPDDWGLVAFFNTPAFLTSGDAPDRIRVQYYSWEDGSESELETQDFLFSDATGTKAPNYSTGLTDDYQVTYFAAFPKNLNKMNQIMGGGTTYHTPASQSDCNFYDVYLAKGSNADLRSMVYRFYISNGIFLNNTGTPLPEWLYPKCKRFDKQRFAYLNKVGVWEYISFRSKRNDKITKSKSEIKKSVFNYTNFPVYENVTNEAFSQNIFESSVAHEGRKIVTQDFKNEFTIFTGYLKRYEIEAVRDMFTSTKLHILDDDGNARAVILTTTSLEDVVVSHKDDQVEYRLTFEYAIPTDGVINM